MSDEEMKSLIMSIQCGITGKRQEVNNYEELTAQKWT